MLLPTREVGVDDWFGVATALGSTVDETGGVGLLEMLLERPALLRTLGLAGLTEGLPLLGDLELSR